MIYSNDLFICLLLPIVVNLSLASQDCIELITGNNLALLCPAYQGNLPPKNPHLTRFTKLQIESAKFPLGAAVLSRQNFTSLSSLTYLKIVSSGLEKIGSDAFKDMQNLADLDLSKNRIRFIEPGVFKGLKLRSLILSGNPGLQFPSGLLVGASVYNFVARDCNIAFISYKLFENSKTKHINLANNKIKTLSPEFTAIIKPTAYGQPKEYPNDQNWGSVDLTNNTLVCDCGLLWLAKLLETQRNEINDFDLYSEKSDSIYHGQRTLRSTRTTYNSTGFEEYMYQMNLTCHSPRWLVKSRFPSPSDFDCPAPRIIGIDVAVLGRALNTIQLTCHAEGRPTPNVAWIFKQNSQEVHRINKSPEKGEISSHLLNEGFLNSGELKAISIALNVSLGEFKLREFSCIAWADTNLPNIDTVDQGKLYDSIYYEDQPLDSKLGYDNPRTVLHDKVQTIQDTAHQVLVRIKGKQFDSEFGRLTDTLLSNNSENVPTPVGDASVDAVHRETVRSSPYNQLFMKRFSPMDLIGAVIGTCFSTTMLLCIITRCVPYYIRSKPKFKPSNSKQYILAGRGGKLSVDLSTNKHQFLNQLEKETKSGNNDEFRTPNEFRITECNGQIYPYNVNSSQYRTQSTESNILESGIPTSGHRYWQIQDIAPSPNTSHEYDMPGIIDPLAGAMPIAVNGTRLNNAGTEDSDGNILRTPLQYASNGFVFPHVASVPPLMINSSSTSGFGQSPISSNNFHYPQSQYRPQSQIFVGPAYFNGGMSPVAFSALQTSGIPLPTNVLTSSALFANHDQRSPNGVKVINIPNPISPEMQKANFLPVFNTGQELFSGQIHYSYDRKIGEDFATDLDGSPADTNETDRSQFSKQKDGNMDTLLAGD